MARDVDDDRGWQGRRESGSRGDGRGGNIASRNRGESRRGPRGVEPAKTVEGRPERKAGRPVVFLMGAFEPRMDADAWGVRGRNGTLGALPHAGRRRVTTWA
jgi:hypothetical protein